MLIIAVLLFSFRVFASESGGQTGECRLITITQGIDLVLKNSRMIKVALPEDTMSFQDSLLARSTLLPQLNAYINKTFNSNAAAIFDSSNTGANSY